MKVIVAVKDGKFSEFFAAVSAFGVGLMNGGEDFGLGVWKDNLFGVGMKSVGCDASEVFGSRVVVIYRWVLKEWWYCRSVFVGFLN